ncbi:MAG TPA: CHRD domain-containing protein [Chitinophagaceae bacterium]|nr:CHRD domain-containing protein [Chitinophagaceae bacterium]
MRTVSVLFALVLFFSAFKSDKATNDGTPLYAMLSGANQTPVMGDPDGSGMAMLRLNQGQGTISFEINHQNIDAPTAAHIHLGAAGSNGPVVVDFEIHGNMTSGEVEVDPELIKSIRQNPAGYYVNVHNASYPGGAIRGQLTK